ncbi:hypothetical protein [Alteromonas sp. ASW11-130]|uniref:hypothetical protein n=1 Tax=Alteromonas sp. ASW11-130 TaxID=3015775 RepID=UPI0022422153|nr:hypothetical protein [Alteromonas sp. ASW11-130]MCW8092251.1 BrnA antitoxin family protein [Alteromonas sp. ASW11-130]
MNQGYYCVIAKEMIEILSVLFQLVRLLNLKNGITEVIDMKDQYDLSKMKSRKNPYFSKLKKPVTMRLSEDVIEYFKGMSEENGVP